MSQPGGAQCSAVQWSVDLTRRMGSSSDSEPEARTAQPIGAHAGSLTIRTAAVVVTADDRPDSDGCTRRHAPVHWAPITRPFHQLHLPPHSPEPWAERTVFFFCFVFLTAAETQPRPCNVHRLRLSSSGSFADRLSCAGGCGIRCWRDRRCRWRMRKKNEDVCDESKRRKKQKIGLLSRWKSSRGGLRDTHWAGQ